MTINPLIPHIPAFLSYLIYGWIMGAVFRFARRGGNGCIIAVILWYALFLVGVFLFGLLSVTSSENQVSFALGFLFPFTRILWESEVVQVPFLLFQNLIRFSRHLFWKVQNVWQAIRETRAPEQKEAEPRSQEQTQSDREPGRQSRTTHDESMRQEQARRAEEARSRREQAERARRDQDSQKEERQKQEQERRRTGEGQGSKKTEPPKSQPKDRDSRSPAEILGLKAPWTEDDLKTAYRREAGRTHPDKWIGKPEAIRQAMEEEYKAIQEAYRKLKG